MAGKNVTVSQAAAATTCTYTVSATSLSFARHCKLEERDGDRAERLHLDLVVGLVGHGTSGSGSGTGTATVRNA